MCINTGTRNKEIRFTEIGDLDTRFWTFDIIHVMEETSCGLPRRIPTSRKSVRSSPTVSCYARSGWRTILWIHQRPSLEEPDDGFLYDIILRAIKHVVEEDLGIKFDLRQCRRTFGQRYLDKDLDIESVSVLMGHASTKTTERFYSRMRLDRAIVNVIGTWNDDG